MGRLVGQWISLRPSFDRRDSTSREQLLSVSDSGASVAGVRATSAREEEGHESGRKAASRTE